MERRCDRYGTGGAAYILLGGESTDGRFPFLKVFYVIKFQLVVQRLAVYLQELRGAAFVVSRLAQCLDDLLLLGLLIVQGQVDAGLCRLMELGQLVQGDELALCQESGAAYDVLHLPEIAGPVILQQRP